LPPSYVFEGLRAIVSGGEAGVMALLFGGCLALLYVFIAYRVFVMVYKNALRTGLLARYSAESLS
jgi:ABC-2 type transport system permease protein